MNLLYERITETRYGGFSTGYGVYGGLAREVVASAGRAVRGEEKGGCMWSWEKGVAGEYGGSPVFLDGVLVVKRASEKERGDGAAGSVRRRRRREAGGAEAVMIRHFPAAVLVVGGDSFCDCSRGGAKLVMVVVAGGKNEEEAGLLGKERKCGQVSQWP
ncbi:hypothetical protein HAX54_029350 [Datura stramonium]|uniref:Uncharacterized protein n=1 Tax=Datura stramonium TaxID=4076 RepID=A0ABS8V942_DATST|nr:hypothetical protein [Datura stramonium]